MRLADARALHAGLVTARADPAADRQGLERLALWCNRFTPWCAVDGEDGLLLDITGCAHLFGGEAALMDEIAARVTGLGVESRLGLADTPGAAWALARFGPAETRIAAPGGTHGAIAGLPVEALRLAAEDAHLLRRLGLVMIGAVDDLPRASLARRFPCRERGRAVLARLDRALGWQAEPIVPMAPPPACLERLALPEPLIDRAGLDAALARLMPGLAASLERDGLGVRRLALWCYRVDGGVVRRAVATARATRDGDHLLRLFRETLETVDPGFGIDLAALHAERVEPLAPTQLSLTGDKQRRGDVDLLVDRLLAKLGEGAVCRLEPVARHRPEQAERAVTPGREPVPWLKESEAPPDAPEAPATPQRPQRPFRLFDRPEPVEVMAEVPAAPGRCSSSGGGCAAASPAPPGPSASSRNGGAGAGGRPETVRDYYRIEDADGRRYWALPRRPLRRWWGRWRWRYRRQHRHRGLAPLVRARALWLTRAFPRATDDAQVSTGPARGLRRVQAVSNFSFLRGASHAEELVERAAALGLTAIGIADRNTLAGAVRAHVAAKAVAAKAAGLRLLTGAAARPRLRVLAPLLSPQPRCLRPPLPPAHPRPAARGQGRLRASYGGRDGPCRGPGADRAAAGPPGRERRRGGQQGGRRAVRGGARRTPPAP